MPQIFQGSDYSTSHSVFASSYTTSDRKRNSARLAARHVTESGESQIEIKLSSIPVDGKRETSLVHSFILNHEEARALAFALLGVGTKEQETLMEAFMLCGRNGGNIAGTQYRAAWELLRDLTGSPQVAIDALGPIDPE